MDNVVEVPSTGEEKDYDDILVDDTEGGVVLLPANEGRKSALIINIGDGSIRVTTDGSVPTANHGKPVDKGGFLVLSSPYCSTKEIKACCQDLVNATVNVSEVD